MNDKICNHYGMENLCFITSVLITGGSDRLLQSLLPRFKTLGYNITVYVAYPGISSTRSDLERQGILVKIPSDFSKRLLICIGFIPVIPLLILYQIYCVVNKKKRVSISNIFPIIENFFVNPIYHYLLILTVFYNHQLKKYSLISGNQYAMYPVLYRLKTLLKIPVFYTEISSPKCRIHILNQIKTKKYLNSFDKVFVPSSIIGEELKRYEGLQNKFYEIPFFIDLPDYIYQIPKKPARSFGLIARLSPEKNHDILIQIFKQVKITIQDAKLILIGTGPQKKQLINIASSLEVLDKIQFIDHFEHIENVIELIDIFTLISDVEGMPLSIIEALYFGKPIIATPVGSLPNMIIDGHNGYIMDKDQIQGIADHIIDLMENFSQYKDMSQNSRLLYERKFKPDSLFNELLLHYKNTNS